MTPNANLVEQANVLADMHHSGLWRSLQLLGDRLGWYLFRPVGYDWFDQGIWSFGREHLGTQLRDQFLTTDGWQELEEPGLWVTYDPEFPAVPIIGVTLPRARRMRWGLVIATAEDNQWGFASFAKGVGARYVNQVGNTRQTVDWSLDPLALVSSEVPILGRGVRYHQEMDPVYCPHDAEEADRWTVRSFVNCMPRIECWPLMADAMAMAPDFRWGVHGIDGPDGTIKPSSVIADLMAGSGWGWHDKITGDGFGHVLWGWAAIGRPIIGHASHYAGKLGEVLWQDGRTCIDLDVHPLTGGRLDDAAIADDAHWYGAMCIAMREVFTANYDPAAEAETIRTLLGGVE